MAWTAAATGREYRLLAGLLGLFAAVYFYLSTPAATPLLDGDDAVYMLMADYFSPFSDRPSGITELIMRHSYFPPLYPMLLGLLGATSYHLQWAHVITVGFLIGAFALYYLWLRSIFPGKAIASLLLTGFALLPVTVFQSFGLLSENLYLMLSLLALWCMNRAGEHVGCAWVAAVAVGLVAVTRSAGIVLVVVYLAHLLWHPGSRRLWPGVLATAPLFAWIGWKWLKGYHGDYTTSFLEILTSTPLHEFLAWQMNNVRREWIAGWTGAFSHLSSPLFPPLALVLGVAGIAGATWRAATGKPDGLYVVGYLALLLVWPYSYEARRFLYVVIPLLLAQGLWAVTELSRRFGGRVATAASMAYLLLMCAVVLPSAGAVALRAAATWEPANRGHGVSAAWYAYSDLSQAKRRETEQLALVRAWKGLAAEVPASECIYHIKPVPLMLYSNRASHATPHANPAAGDYLDQATECRFFYVGAYVYAPYREAFYPAKLLGARARVLRVDYLEEETERRPLGMLLVVIPKNQS